MTQKDLEDLTNALYDEGLTDDEVQTELAKLDSEPAATAPAPAAPAAKPGLLSPETLAPATMAAINAGPQPGDSAMVQSQLDIQKAAPMATMVPGGMGMPAPIVSQQSMQAGLGAVSDWFGKGFRLAGSLIPSRITRGTTADPTAPMGQRTRTFTESMQNPEGSLLTGLGEDINNSNAPNPVKAASKLLLGAGEGGIAGAAEGVAGQTVKNLLSKGAVASGAADVAEGAAKYIQNVRMGTNASDIAKGASAGNAMKYGLGNKTLKNALPLAQQKIDAWSAARDAIYKQKESPEISLESVQRDVQDKIGPEDKFGFAEKNAALQEIKDEVRRIATANPKVMVSSEGFTPRRAIGLLTQDEIQAGVNNGTIRYDAKAGGKIPFVYSSPEVPPENFLPKQGGVYLNLKQADEFKNWLQDQGANFGKGMPRESKVSEKVFRDVYNSVTQRAESYGGPEYAKLNKSLSELIPIRNTIERALKRGELGSDVVDKMGAVKATANAAASATGLNRFGATGVYNAAQGVKEAAQVPLQDAINTGAQQGFMSGMLRGSLSDGSR